MGRLFENRCVREWLWHMQITVPFTFGTSVHCGRCVSFLPFLLSNESESFVIKGQIKFFFFGSFFIPKLTYPNHTWKFWIDAKQFKNWLTFQYGIIAYTMIHSFSHICGVPGARPGCWVSCELVAVVMREMQTALWAHWEGPITDSQCGVMVSRTGGW